jgi:uncharacterized protein (DUF433 family)
VTYTTTGPCFRCQLPPRSVIALLLALVVSFRLKNQKKWFAFSIPAHYNGFTSKRLEFAKGGLEMENNHLLDRITTNPEVMVGKPIIRSLRITVEQILKALAAGVSQEELLEDYPELEVDDFRAVLLYAAEVIAEEQVFDINGRS